MAFGLVYSSAERSTSRHGHTRPVLGCSLVPVGFGFGSWFYCMEMAEFSTFPGLQPGMWYWFRVAYPIFGILKETWKPQKFRGYT